MPLIKDITQRVANAPSTIETPKSAVPTARPMGPLYAAEDYFSENLTHDLSQLRPQTPSSPSPAEVYGAEDKETKEAHQKNVEEKAATVLQTRWRGLLARKKTVMPSEISSFLRANWSSFLPYAPVDVDALSQVMAREIQNYINDPKQTGPRLIQAGASYPTAEGALSAPMDMWVSKTPKGIELELVGPLLRYGATKEVFKTLPMGIDLSSPKHEVTPSDTVLLRAVSPEGSQLMLDGQDLIQHLAEQLKDDPRFKVAGVLTHTDREHQGLIHARDKAFRGDMADLMDEHLKTPVTGLYGWLQLINDAAQTLQVLHEQGCTHGDVKPENIMVSKDLRGYIGDFDTLQQNGPTLTRQHTPGYADALYFAGARAPTADIFAMAEVLAHVLFSASMANVDAQRRQTANPDFVEQLINGRDQRLSEVKSPIKQQALSGLADLIHQVAIDNQNLADRLMAYRKETLGKRPDEFPPIPFEINALSSAFTKMADPVADQENEQARAVVERLYPGFWNFASFLNEATLQMQPQVRKKPTP